MGSLQGSPLVSADWLLAHLGDDDVVVLDASITRGEDATGATVFSDGTATVQATRIAGAVFADLFRVWSQPDAEYGFTRPDATQVVAAAKAAGINPDSTVVVYDQLSGAYASRLWFVLRSWGFTGVRVLDGGFAAWTAAGGPVESGEFAPVAPGSGFTPVETGLFADLDEVREIALGDRAGEAHLVCALRRPEFEGDPARERSGHIPGSVNVPYPDLLDADGTVSVEQTRALAAELGLDGDVPVLAYCGGGVNASGLALAFAEAGLALPRVYDASMGEWRAHAHLPVVLGPAEARVRERQDKERETLVIFDIDGTLLHSDGTHNALITVVQARHGLDATIKPFGTYTHYTDWCVIDEVHTATHGTPVSTALLHQLNAEYAAALDEHLAGTVVEEVAGARALLTELDAMPGVHVAFATGSLRGMARTKLSLVGIDADAAVLSTSLEHYSREEIVLGAIEETARRVGHDRFDVVILGDGAWDERTARGLGIPFVGLATGSHGFEDDAVLVVPDFADVTADDLVHLARPVSLPERTA